MTDTLHPVTTIASHEPTRLSLSDAFPFSHTQRYVIPALDGMQQEDDGQISCFCGFADDDGNTVACDECNRWNHSLCYYPEYDGRQLPDDLQHYCVECKPRPLDAHAAWKRQQHRREEQDIAANGTRRQPAKSHKKKIKEPGSTPYTNGWPLDKARHDRNSASPRDQPPPAKRPKTSHRSSDSSTPAPAKGHTRKRTVTNATHRRSLSRSPESPVQLYSTEFMHQSVQDAWAPTDVNLHADIRVTNELSAWLHASSETFTKEHGQNKGQILKRWDGELEDIPGKAEYDIINEHDHTVADEHGNHPNWKRVIVRGEPVADGAYIGELRGHVGFKDDYKKDEANRWNLLRHPEPYVFFHPQLPIYIDARHEGTELRYVRRSCSPNATLQVLVTGNTNYRFCVMATKQIEPGMEVAVGWDTAESVRTSSNGNLSSMDMDMLGIWVSTVLSNCGPCACSLPANECAMSRFDRRRSALDREDETRPAKMPKLKKKRPGQHISPLNTNALNSRSGSEARRLDAEDEPTDSRSTSGSGGRGSTSRDITPNTHYSTNGSLSIMPEMSERERKKLAKEEEMFRRQEEERTGKQLKKKRGSAGSALNTPSATSSRQAEFPRNNPRYSDAGTAKQSGLPAARSVSGKRAKSSTAPKNAAQPYVKLVSRPKPDYVDATVQCDMDQVEAEQHATNPKSHRKYISVTQRLLERCARNNAMSRASRRKSGSSSSPASSGATEADGAIREPQAGSTNDRASPTPSKESAPAPKAEDVGDVQMDDAPELEDTLAEPDTVPLVAAPVLESASNDATLSPAPPWPAKLSVAEQATSADPPEKPEDMQLQMPPPPKELGALHSMPSTETPTTITGSIAQSPATLGPSAPLFSPSVTAAVHPSPARKKLSLSDYTRRSKAKDKDHDAKERDSSPASVASGPIVPPLQPSSSSEVAAVKEGGSAIEDVRMEDARP